MLRLINRLLRFAGLEIKRRPRHGDGIHKGIAATLPPKGECLGNALISYIPDDVLSADDDVSASHTHYWECRQMATSFAEAGFAVDVVHFADDHFVPEKPYDVLVSARTNLERLAKHLSPECLKIAHLDTAHFLTHNANALQRLRRIRDRHGISLRSNRMVEDNWAIEVADIGCVLGNSFTADSYGFAGKPIHRIPLSSVRQFDWQDDKDFDACRAKFLWFGSGGFAHKGLDLVIDAFTELPDLELLICGPTDQEPRFLKAFDRQMFHTSNIKTIGWIDVTGEEFTKLRRGTVATIYPSCSEGGGGSVITCMHAGMLPVVTREASVNIGDSGLILKSASVEAIREAVIAISNMPAGKLRDRAKSAWQLARSNHTREKFAEHYDRFVADVIVPEVARRQSNA